jgi:hypothetical protein
MRRVARCQGCHERGRQLRRPYIFSEIQVLRRRVPPSQGWRTFLRDHADGIAAMDLFVVPTISFRPLYGLLIIRSWVDCITNMLGLDLRWAQHTVGTTRVSVVRQ